MAQGIHVQFSGELQSFIQKRVLASGLYSTPDEYIRDLVRHDYEKEENRKWERLRDELQSGLLADDSEFQALDADELIAAAKERRTFNGR